MVAGIALSAFRPRHRAFHGDARCFTPPTWRCPPAEKKRRIAVFCGNTALCKITEDLIFTDPYRVAELNRWTSPQLDADRRRDPRGDAELKMAVSALKGKFLTAAEAMIHGDLHTGSIMVTATETKVIDPEFAFYGPMGFDIGAVIGNLLLAYFARPAMKRNLRSGTATGAGFWIRSIRSGPSSRASSWDYGATITRATSTPPPCSPIRKAKRRYAGCGRTTRRGCSPTRSVSPPPR